MKNKKTLLIILGLILIIAAGITVFISSENAKSKPNNQYVTVKYKEASVGSILNVELSDEGKSEYPQAEKYFIYSEEGLKELSIVFEKLGTETTVYPKVFPGDKIQVFLYDKNEQLIVKLESKVIK